MKSNLLDMARRLVEKKKPFVVAKVIKTTGSTPGKKGAWLLMTEDEQTEGTVGGGILEENVKDRAKQVLKNKKGYVYEFILNDEQKDGLDMRCGGNIHIEFEYIDYSNGEKFLSEFRANCIAYIFGGGHVGQAVEPILRYVGFDTVVIDDRPEFANKELFPEAKAVMTIKDYKDCYQNIKTDKNSYIVILTRGHGGDYDVLKQSLQRESAYIGMIGSRRKVLATFEGLKSEGITEKQLERVNSPIGLAIGAESPQEIAISIVAEMIKIRAERTEK